MKYIVLDTETNTKNVGEGAVGDMKASPFHEDNHIVALGWKHAGMQPAIYYGKTAVSVGCAGIDELLDDKLLIVGHNIGFDLHYLLKDFPILYDKLHNLYVWDTQQVAYLLSGQTHMYPSLNECCEEIDYPLKNDAIKAYWDAGIETAMIPQEELNEYLIHDVNATEAVFLYQYHMIKDNPALFNLIRVKMDDILATTMMERNGMAFDRNYALESAMELEMRVAGDTAGALALVAGLFVPRFEFNPMSNDHVSLAMFGGEYKIKMTVPKLSHDGEPERFKTGTRKGEIKTRMEDVVFKTKGFGLTPLGTPNAKGIYPVGDDVMEAFKHVPFVRYIKQIREDSKQQETYFLGYSKLVWPDGCIHPSIGNCGTRTGRNNHSKPNLGNVTRGE